MAADIHALHIPDLLCNCVIVGLLGSIKHSEAHLMPTTFSFSQYSIFMFFTLCNLCVVLRHTDKYVCTLSNIDNLTIQQDRINARTFKPRR